MNTLSQNVCLTMRYWKRSTFALLLLAAVWFSPIAAAADPQTTTSASQETGEVDLYSLSDAELEEICTVRGFELVHDDENVAFTHEDYVEAARQCLAIEQDMEEIIAEHPEILSELEQERDRMLAEKERLEQELEEAEKRADGRQPHVQHAAFVSHTTEPEEVVDLDDEEEFDVIGHQEPLSDSRVHEEEVVVEETTTEDSAISEKDENTVSMGDTMRGFKERVIRDFNAVANVVFPKSMRGPTKHALIQFGRIVKREAMNVYKFLKRYIKAFIEKRKNTTDEEAAGAAGGGDVVEQAPSTAT